MPAKVVNHVALGAETLAALLRALEGPLVVMDPHMDVQNMAIVELFTTTFNRADNILSTGVVRHMRLHVLQLLECLGAAFVAALEQLGRRYWLALNPLEQLAGFMMVV